MAGWACIIRLGGIGDDLIASSVGRPLKTLGYKVEFIASAPQHVVLQNNPFIDKLTVKEAEKDLQAWVTNRAQEYELCVHLSHSVENRHALFKHSTAFWWPADYRRKLCAGNYLETQMDIAGVPHMFGPLYFPTQDELEFVRRSKAKIGDRCVAWVLSGTRIDK